MKTQFKKTSLILCGMVACGIFAGIQSAQANAVENFNYADGALAGQNGGSGWAGAWYGETGNATITATGGKLDFTTAGSSATTSAIFRNLAAPIDTGTAYLSVRMQSKNGGLRYFGVNPFTAGGLLFGSGSTRTHWTVDKVLTNGVASVLESDVLITEEALMVLKVDFDASTGGENELLTFWINPNESIPVWQLNVADAVGGQSYETSTDFGSLGGLRAVSGGYKTSYTPGFSDFTVDDISVIPEPATLGLIGLIGAGMFAARRFFPSV